MKKFTVKKNNLEMVLATTAEKMTAVVERIEQKKETAIAKIPFLKKISDRIKAYDDKMTAKHGYLYTKIRDSIKNTVRTIAAYKLFGLPGLVGMCAYKTGEKIYSLLKPAQKAAKEGTADGVLDYLKKNKKESCFTLTSASLSVASAASTVASVPAAVDAIRVGKASLLALPELRNVLKSTARWICGKEDFKEVYRDSAILGVTVATYFAGNNGVPMTRGQGKPLDDSGDKKIKKADLSNEKKAALGNLVATLKQGAR